MAVFGHAVVASTPRAGEASDIPASRRVVPATARDRGPRATGQRPGDSAGSKIPRAGRTARVGTE